MKKSQLYTATGDHGTTSLIGGTRIDKDAPKIEAYGTVDELNSQIGLLAAHMTSDPLMAPEFPVIQSRLFDIGSSLATPSLPATPPPAGATPADVAHAHVARTVCRRAERRVIALSKLEPVDPVGLVYLNRLSDLLFAVARRCNVTAGCPEVEWKRRGAAE